VAIKKKINLPEPLPDANSSASGGLSTPMPVSGSMPPMSRCFSTTTFGNWIEAVFVFLQHNIVQKNRSK
jgi:hypothetical protein